MTRESDDRRVIFAAEYAKDRNGTRAAIAAGYAPGSAKVTASRLLTDANVRALVANHQARVVAKAEVTAERVVAEYARIAFADMRRFATVKNGGVALTDSSEWTDDDAAAVAEVGETVSKDGGSVRFKLHSKVAALDALAKYLGLFSEGDGAELVERVIFERRTRALT